MVNQHGSMFANRHGTQSALPRQITNEIRSRELADPLVNECYRDFSTATNSGAVFGICDCSKNLVVGAVEL
jgi:hypothetical protein